MKQELDSLLVELKCEKVASRNKAFNRLDALLNSRQKELKEISDNNHYLSFQEFFEAAHIGLKKQCYKWNETNAVITENDPKLLNYIKVVQKILNVAYETDEDQISARRLAQCVTEIILEKGFSKYYGSWYLQILQKFILKSKYSVSELKTSQWTELLESCFKLLRRNDTSISTKTLGQTLENVIEVGVKYSHIEMKDMQQFLPLLCERINMINPKNAVDYLRISYYICKNMVVQRRMTVCEFTEQILENINKHWDRSLSDDIKTTLFRLMDLTLLCHFPILNSDRTHVMFVADQQRWEHLLRNFKYVVETEVNAVSVSTYRNSNGFEMNLVLKKLAARLYYLLYWNQEPTLNGNTDNGEPSSKRHKPIEKLQNVIDLVNKSDDKIDWRWFIVLGELLFEYPETLSVEDFQQLLTLLESIQNKIEYKTQLIAYIKCTFVMLKREPDFLSKFNEIVQNFCDDLWNKINESALRNCAAVKNLSNEWHILLQTLLNFKKITSKKFALEIINYYFFDVRLKNDKTVKTLISVYENFNMDTMEDTNELSIKILKYLMEKPKISDLKNVIMNTTKPRIDLIAQLIAICCLSKSDVFNFRKDVSGPPELDSPEAQSYNRDVANMISRILLKSSYTLLIDLDDFDLPGKLTSAEHVESDDRLKCIINENILGDAMNLISSTKKVLGESCDIDAIAAHLIILLENVALFINVMDQLFKYQALNEKNVSKESFVIKKYIAVHFEEIASWFEKINASHMVIDLKDTLEILNLLQKLFNTDYCVTVCKYMRSLRVANLFQWCMERVNDDAHEFNNYVIGEDEFAKAKGETLVKYKALHVLVSYLQHFSEETEDYDDLVGELRKVKFNVDDNVEIHTIFLVTKYLGRQEIASEQLIVWILTYIQNICKNHYKNQYVSEQIIQLFPEIFRLSEKCQDTRRNVLTMVKSFVVQCAKKNYGLKLTIECINQLRSFHKWYFYLYNDDSSGVPRIYEEIINQLYSPMFEIKLAAIKCVSYIIKTDFDDTDYDGLVSVKTMKISFWEKISRKDLVEVEDPESADGLANELAISLNFITSTLCVNYLLRKSMVLEISKIAFEKAFTMEKGRFIFEKILRYLKCDVNSLMDDKMVLFLVSNWLKKNLPVTRFPWYFTKAEFWGEFIQMYTTKIYLAMLRQSIDTFEDFCSEAKEKLANAIKNVLPNLIAYMTPFDADCSILYKGEARALRSYLEQKHMTPSLAYIQKSIDEILENIFEYVYDKGHFKQLTKYDLEIQKETEYIGNADIDKCLEYFRKNLYPRNRDKLFTIFCCETPSIVEKLLTAFKGKILDSKIKEQKILYFMQYCVILENLFDYLRRQFKENEIDIKLFVMRDVSHFLCYLISMEDANFICLNMVSSYFMQTFLENVLPHCVDEFKPFLNHVTSTLLSVCKKTTSNKDLLNQCLSLLKLLIINPLKEMEDVIAKLDGFPNEEKFVELRENHLKIKYKYGEFSLEEEIAHFLTVDLRNIEGLNCLRENLASKKKELKKMFLELSKSSRLTEDVERNILHKLIRALLKHVNGPDNEKGIEASRCLGEIGAYDLARMVFNFEDVENSTIYFEITSLRDTIEFAFKEVLDQLSALIINPEKVVFESSSNALHYLMRSSLAEVYISAEIRPFVKKTHDNFDMFTKPKGDLKLVEFLNQNEYTKYTDWIKNFSKMLFEQFGNSILGEIASLVITFAEKMLPILFQLLLSYTGSSIYKQIFQLLNYFFDKHNNIQKSMTESIYLNKFAIKIMLEVTESVRFYQMNGENIINEELNYLHIAKAARFCQAEFTSVFYCELWAQNRLDKNNIQFSTSLVNKDLQEIMKESYMEIGMKDAASVFVNVAKSRFNYIQLQGNMQRILLEQDAQGTSEKELEIYQQCLIDSGLYSLASQLPSTTPQYECFWRLSNWSILTEKDYELDVNSKASDFKREFEKCHYTALKCLNNRDELGTSTSIQKSRQLVVELLKRSSLECMKNVYKFIGMLQQVQQIEDFSRIQFKSNEYHPSLVSKWNEQNDIPYSDFQYIEPILAQRNVVLNTAAIRAGRRTWIPEVLQNNYLLIIKQARMSKNCEGIALRNIAEMTRIENLSPTCQTDLFLQEAQLSWKMNDTKMAMKLLSNVIKDKNSNLLQKSEAHRLFGEYAAHSSSEDIEQIFNNNFKPSLKMLEDYAKESGRSQMLHTMSQHDFSYDDPESLKIVEYLSIYESIAKYYDRQYNAVVDYMNSDSYQKRLQSIEKNTVIVNDLAMEVHACKEPKLKLDKQKSYVIAKKNLDIDKKEKNNLESKISTIALHTMLYYIRYAIIDPSVNLQCIFRIISFWFNNQNDEKIQDLMDKRLNCISNYKFISAMPQLTARLHESNTKTISTLTQLLEDCARKHPHHIISLLLNLANSNVDSTETNDEIEARIKAANDILSRLQDNDPRMTRIINQYSKMSLALIDLANLERISAIPRNHAILKIVNYDSVHCPTLELPVSPKGEYGNITSVIKWEDRMSMVGGINAPKKVFCLCSDGITRPQLLKGKDDLRQDAVMQQVFTIMNEILKNNKETQSHHLSIRTYKIVPLTRRSGILEWCSNCVPIKLYLLGNGSSFKGAHEKFRPNDWTPNYCRNIMQEYDILRSAEKLEKFKEICDNIKPVFHNFFLENFLQPGVWFERRLQYVKSVATTSMVGYILGIGDRHIDNILIDKDTGDVVHIDFGIAFEQGKILPHPETIPFRLTRDIVAPMGICKVNGTFTKLCQKVLSVIRENEVILTTILEVLLYDPLYAWTMTSSKAVKYQQNELNMPSDFEQNVKQNVTASRALLRIMHKIRGQDDIASGYSSVEGQVERLIQEATNIALWSKLFVGWQPYL